VARTPLLIAGAGGFARETAAAVEAINVCEPTWDLLGHLDDDPARLGATVGGSTVLGPIDLVTEHPQALVVVCIGNPRSYRVKHTIVGRLGLPADRYATIVHPTASIGAGTTIGAGSVLLAGVTATTDVTIGAHVAVMPDTTLTHDDVVGDQATFGSGVRLGGSARIGEGAYLGAGCLVREGLTVGAWSQVGMGSVVLDDIPAGEVWVGSPARHLRPATPDGVRAAAPSRR
jgi:sugar O-acyltransferase (sialic acid O-acetyltransferase NeuD family)